jgi:hypothetical protein
LRRHDLTDIATLPAVEPPDLVAALKTDRELAREAVKYLAIMMLVDGVLDRAKLGRVLAYARALDERLSPLWPGRAILAASGSHDP